MDNEINGFDEGVAAGGLRNTVQIKILFEFLARALSGQVSKEILLQAVTISSLANYFEASQALDELIGSGNLAESENGIELTGKGNSNLNELLPDLPVTVRETALGDSYEALKKAKIKQSNSASVEDRGDHYDVICTVRHGGDALMSLTLYAPDLQTALSLAQNFRNDPEKIYSQVMNVFYEGEGNKNA